jgi:hypothetical protein
MLVEGALEVEVLLLPPVELPPPVVPPPVALAPPVADTPNDEVVCMPEAGAAAAAALPEPPLLVISNPAPRLGIDRVEFDLPAELPEVLEVA